MSDSVYLYPLPLDAARKNGEIAKWRESFWENVRCKQAVEAAIRESFDGTHLDTVCVTDTVDKYGYARLRYVLANTVQELWHDGRFSVTNKEWSKQVYIPPDREHNYQFCVSSHPAVLDGFISEFRKLDMSFAGRIGKEYADYEAEMLTHPASYVFSHADEISAMQSCYVYLTNCLSYQQNTEQLEELMHMDKPLAALRERWLDEGGVDHTDQFSDCLCALTDIEDNTQAAQTMC